MNASLRYEVVGSKSNTRFMIPLSSCDRMIGVQTMSCRFGSRSRPLTCCLEAMQLLRRGFCTAVPRLRKVRDGRADVQVVERRSDPAERLVSLRPDSLEHPAARKPLFFGSRDKCLNLLLQRI